MNVLWVIPAPIDGMQDVVSSDVYSSSGTWISAAIESCASEQLFELSVAVLSCKTQTRAQKGGVQYIGLNLPLERGRRTVRADRFFWRNLIDELKPDIIQLSGTEYSFGLDLIASAQDNGIPVIVSIHGVMRAISKYPIGNMKLSSFKQYGNYLSWMKAQHYRRYHNAVTKQTDIEAKLIEGSDAVIVDSMWEESFCNAASGGAKRFYRIPLPLEEIYQKYDWSANSLKDNTIFCVAGRTPYKGLHDAIDAIALLEKCYGIKATLQIPGDVSFRGKWLRRPPYLDLINRKIKRLHLQDRVVFLGRLSTPEMCSHMSRASIFIMPSCIENQSATLRQAMLLGVPVVTSMVGSIHEFVNHGQNGLLYRYGEYEVLARELYELLSLHSYTQELGKAGKQSMRSLYSQSTATSLFQSYCDLIVTARG